MKKRYWLIVPVAVLLAVLLTAAVVLLPLGICTGSLDSSQGNLSYRFNPITGVLLVLGQGECDSDWAFTSPFLDAPSFVSYYAEIPSWRELARDAWYGERLKTVIVLAESNVHDYFSFSGYENLKTVYLADGVTDLGDSCFQTPRTLTVYVAGDAPGFQGDTLPFQSETPDGLTVVYHSGAQGFAEWGDQATAGFVPGWFWLLF